MRNVLNPCFECGEYRCNCPKTNARYIGLSFSGVLHDILEGEVESEQVVAIVPGTHFPTVQDAIDAYQGEAFCKYNPEVVKALIVALWPRVMQPRAVGLEPVHGSHVWVQVE